MDVSTVGVRSQDTGDSSSSSFLHLKVLQLLGQQIHFSITCGLSAIGLIFLLCHLRFCDSISIFFMSLPGPLSSFGGFLLLAAFFLARSEGMMMSHRGSYCSFRSGASPLGLCRNRAAP